MAPAVPALTAPGAMKLIPSPALAKACSDRNRLAIRVAIYPRMPSERGPRTAQDPTECRHPLPGFVMTSL